MEKVKVRLDRKRSYDILIGHRLIPRIGEFLMRLGLGKDAVIIANPCVYSIYGGYILKGFKRSSFEASILRIPDGEKSKSSREVVRLVEAVVKKDRGRGIFIAAFGGGVVGDVAGFLASIYKRGIPYIQIPTTLLAQVDSAIGGKVAIDLVSAKNLVGSFYQPRLVISDTYILKSLPLRQIRSGLSEVIKYGIIKEAPLFEFLEKNVEKILKLNRGALEHIICRSSKIKAKIVQRDEYDKKGIRASLNYGHTIGHAIEAACKYSRLYSHGEAVAIGMVAAARIAAGLGVLKKESSARIARLIEKTGLPVTITKRLKMQMILKAQSYDKKVIHGINRFVLPVSIGRVRIYEGIPEALIGDTIKSLYK